MIGSQYMVGLTNGNLWGLIESLEIHHGISHKYKLEFFFTFVLSGCLFIQLKCNLFRHTQKHVLEFRPKKEVMLKSWILT